MNQIGPLTPRDTGPITQVSVTEVSVETTGLMKEGPAPGQGTRLSKIALGAAVGALVLAPVFGLGVIPGILGMVLGQIGRRSAPSGRVRSTVAVAISAVGLVISTAVLVFLTLPLSLAFLVSAGYILDN